MGSIQGQNPYRFLRGLDLEMKACIEYLWPTVHQCLREFATISLAFAKGKKSIGGLGWLCSFDQQIID